MPRREREVCCSHRPLVRRALRLSSFLQWTIMKKERERERESERKFINSTEKVRDEKIGNKK